jgi:ionotropic glutamate receptor NMDA 2B
MVYRQEKKEWNGIIKTLLNGDADMAVTSLKITPERSKEIDFSVPFLETGITILVPVRDGVISPTAFLGGNAVALHSVLERF